MMALPKPFGLSAVGLIATLFILTGRVESKLIRNIPENGIGHLMLSTDDSHQHYNEKRLMVMFNLECLGDNENSFHSFDSNPLSTSNQQLKVNSIIDNHYPCLSHDRNINFQQFKSGFGMSFLNINDENCLENNKSNIKLDYNEHCIHLFTYEPLFSLYFGEDYTKYSNDDYTCNTQSTQSNSLPDDDAWGLDQTDSFNADNLYQYPNIDSDNGVDLYIVDSGIRATHDEFATNNIYHMLGDGAAYYEPQDWYGSHGTHVAGSAGGLNYGVSKNLDIYDYRVCEYASGYAPSSEGDYPCFTSLIFSALNDISKILGKNGANSGRRGVINMSLGGGRSFWSNLYEYYFESIIENGGIVVVAAGNSYTDACDFSPAWTTSAITVGAANSSYHKAYFSNWGECVDVWAPGQSIVSGIADCDDCYTNLQGTSMASPHIAGFVANLLWVDPTLTYHEVKSLLKQNTTVIGGSQCELYTCLYPFYQCDTIPSEWYGIGNTIAPKTTDKIENIDNGISGVLPNYGCNVVGEAVIDPLNDNEIVFVDYEPADKCISLKEDNDDIFSYSYECVSDDTAEFIVWDNADCSGDGTGTLTIENGWIDGDYWYYVDCSNKNERKDEEIAIYDESDCDLIYRIWYPDEYVIGNSPITGELEYQCVYNESSAVYYDTGKALGACSYEINETLGIAYSWDYSCTNNSFTVTYYDNLICNDSEITQQYTNEEACYVYNTQTSTYALHLEILECGTATTEVYESDKSSGVSDDSGTLMILFIVGASSGLFLALMIVLGYNYLSKSKNITIIPIVNNNINNRRKFLNTNDHLTTHAATNETHDVVAAGEEDDHNIDNVAMPAPSHTAPVVPVQQHRPPPVPSHLATANGTRRPPPPPPSARM